MKVFSLVMISLLIITACMIPEVQAQSNVKVTQVIFDSRTLARDTGDSVYTTTGAFFIQYPRGGALSEIRGQWPDSVRIIGFKSLDSTGSVQIRWKAKNRNATLYTSTVIDSMYSATAIESTTGKTITVAQMQNCDDFGIGILAHSNNTLINALNKATSAKYTVVLECWYKKP